MKTSDWSVQEKYFNEFIPPIGFKVPDNFLIPRFKSVIIKKDDRREAVTKTGITLVEVKSAPPSFSPTGRVYGVGPEINWLKPGMRVVYNMYSNLEIYHEGISYLMVYDTDVQACIPEEAVVTTEKKAVEKRREIPHDELPDVYQSQEEIKMQQEEAREVAEHIKKDVTTKHFAIDGTKKENQ